MHAKLNAFPRPKANLVYLIGMNYSQTMLLAQCHHPMHFIIDPILFQSSMDSSLEDTREFGNARAFQDNDIPLSQSYQYL